MIGDVRIERATPDDLNPVLALLALHDLPPDALEEHLATMLVARRGGDVGGAPHWRCMPMGHYCDPSRLRLTSKVRALAGC